MAFMANHLSKGDELATPKRDAAAEPIAEATPIHHCWEAPDGQIHCDPQKRDAQAEPSTDVSHRHDPLDPPIKPFY